MSGLERKNLELLMKNPLLHDDERTYVSSIIRECGWAHPLTEAMLAEISKIRADCATQHRNNH